MHSHKKTLLSLWVTMAAAGIPLSQVQAQESGILEEVVIQGVRSADLNAREVERQRDVFSNVISQDDAGNFTDQNVAEALQRLPGITLQKSDGQGEFVNVRGLGPSFVGVSLNNSELASSGTDSRAVALNAIPADLMGSIEVFKTLTPDMDLNSIAGRVNVNSITAFDRGRDEFRISVQGAMHEQRGEFSPKVTLQGTKLFAEDTVGIAVSFSHEERGTEVNQIHHGSNLPRYIRASQPIMGGQQHPEDPNSRARHPLFFQQNYFEDPESNGADPFYDAPRMLTPDEFEVRQDESVRTRNAGTFNIGWRPNSESEYFFRYDRSEFTDEELTMREQFRFGQADARYIVAVSPEDNYFIVSNADLQHHVFFEEGKDITTTWALGGENIFNETWTLDYEYHTSKGVQRNPDDRRVQFRTRALPMIGVPGQDDIIAQVISQRNTRELADQFGTNYEGSIPGTGGFVAGLSGGVQGYELGARRQPNMRYDNIFLEDGFREDELSQIEVNLRKDLFDAPANLNYIKTGFQIKERERIRTRDRWSVNPSDFPDSCRLRDDTGEVDDTGATQAQRDCLDWANISLGSAGFETFTPRNPRFDHDFITLADAQILMDVTRRIPENLDPNRTSALSRAQDYQTFEDSWAAYLMAEFQVMDNATLIVGARYDATEYGSSGWLSLRHDRYLSEDSIQRDITIPLTDEDGSFMVTKYDGVYPGIHFRYEPRDNLLVRTSLWTSFNRPNFSDARANAAFQDRVTLFSEQSPENRPSCSDNLRNDINAPNFREDMPTAHIEWLAENASLCRGNELDLGNTDLVALEATHLDASVSWYGEGGDFFEASLFYKQIDDFIVDVRGLSIPRDELPLAVQAAVDRIDSSDSDGPDPNDVTRNVFRIDQDYIFHDVSTTINGDRANVYGMELSYNKFFDMGVFLQSNITLLSSSADAGETVRADKTRLPNQADVTANLVLGWENQDFSARLISNYRSKVLRQLGTCSQADIDQDAEWARLNDAGNPDALPGAVGDGTVYHEACQNWADVFHDATFLLDFKATYQWRNARFYFDVLNITEDVDVFYFRGNEHSNGPILFESEGLGRTFQVGVNVRF